MKRDLMICDRCGADDFSGRVALMRFAKLTVVGGNVDADDHGGTVLGWKTVCAVEIADYPVAVLRARQRDGILKKFPIHRDIRTFD